jgi:hypothetical protein
MHDFLHLDELVASKYKVVHRLVPGLIGITEPEQSHLVTWKANSRGPVVCLSWPLVFAGIIEVEGQFSRSIPWRHPIRAFLRRQALPQSAEQSRDPCGDTVAGVPAPC